MGASVFCCSITGTVRSRFCRPSRAASDKIFVLPTSQSTKPTRLCGCFDELLRSSLLRLLRKEKTRLPDGSLVFFGDPSEIRTPDTLIKSQVLCQLS